MVTSCLPTEHVECVYVVLHAVQCLSIDGIEAPPPAVDDIAAGCKRSLVQHHALMEPCEGYLLHRVAQHVVQPGVVLVILRAVRARLAPAGCGVLDLGIDDGGALHDLE